MAASRGATDLDAWSDLGGVGIWGQRTGLGGAHWETAGVLHSQAQPAIQAGGVSSTRSRRAWQFGEVHLQDLKGGLAGDRWDRNCCGLGCGWQTSRGPCEEEGFSPGCRKS